MYLSVKSKFFISLALAFAWSLFSLWIAQRWLEELSELISATVAYLIIFGIAIIPGFMNAFMISSLFLDKRKSKKIPEGEMPFVSILIAAYNEEESVQSTLASIDRQNYPGRMEVFVIDDGSTDGTAQKLSEISYPWLKVITLPKNGGKAAALNVGLAQVTSDLTITIDGDSYLYKDALVNLVGRLLGDPEHTGAVAGAVLVRNSRKNLVTKVQEWDYFHGIAAVKRLQSLYQGTLVAQGAFSIYKTSIIRKVGGWPKLVGEDIVLTWAILKEGYRVGYAEDACLFTNAPDTWKQFIRQRQRWSRGLIEAFKLHWRLMFRMRMTTLFIWWNAMFPYMDVVYTFAFIPGVILALFGHYYIAGPLTLFVLPLSLTVNFVMYGVQNRMFTRQGLRVRRNFFGFAFYALLYSAILQPACIFGYLKELFSRDKSWGTK
jgi:biofilm PGA synthesis N-glycosyltransferase PgaC